MRSFVSKVSSLSDNEYKAGRVRPEVTFFNFTDLSCRALSKSWFAETETMFNRRAYTQHREHRPLTIEQLPWPLCRV